MVAYGSGTIQWNLLEGDTITHQGVGYVMVLAGRVLIELNWTLPAVVKNHLVNKAIGDNITAITRLAEAG